MTALGSDPPPDGNVVTPVTAGYQDRAYPWVGLVAAAGAGMVGVVAVQLILALIQGVALRPGQWGNVADDLFQRLGFPFGGLGAPAALFLIVALALLALPDILEVPLTAGQDRTNGLAVTATVAMSAVLAIGAVLSARASVLLYAASNPGAVPPVALLQFISAFLGSLGASALGLFMALRMRRLRLHNSGLAQIEVDTED